jgi:hypothetical protein
VLADGVSNSEKQVILSTSPFARIRETDSCSGEINIVGHESVSVSRKEKIS